MRRKIQLKHIFLAIAFIAVFLGGYLAGNRAASARIEKESQQTIARLRERLLLYRAAELKSAVVQIESKSETAESAGDQDSGVAKEYSDEE
ncbi:MAG: hypothetical protein ACE361_20085 [Aureliella sp.]